MYRSFDISINFPSVRELVSGVLRDVVPVISFTVLLPIKQSVASAVFKIYFLEVVSRTCVADYLARPECFDNILTIVNF